MIRPIALLLFCSAVTPIVLGDCACHRPEKGEATRPGANEFVIEVEKESYRSLEGTAEMYDGRTLENALIEIFDHPDYLLSKNALTDHPLQKRIGACRTAADGRFCCRHLDPGKYELRSSINGGWNITHVYVVVDKKAGLTKKLHVKMHLGT